MSQKFKKYLTLAGGYTGGVFLNQIINFLMIPIYWRVLTPEDFGVIAIAQMIQLILTPLFIFGASDTIQRFYYQWPEANDERKHRLGWIYWILIGATCLITLFLDLTGSLFSSSVIESVPFDPALKLALWTVFLANLMNIPIAISRIQQRVLAYNFLFNGTFLTQVGLTIYLVLFEKKGAIGYLQAGLYTQLIWLIPIFWQTQKNIRLFPSKKYFEFPYRFAGPLALSGFLDGITTMIDRFFLDKLVPLSTIGFMNLGRQFAGGINIINSISKLLFFPYIYKVHSLNSNAPRILGDFGVLYAGFMLLPLIGVLTAASELTRLLDPSGVYLQIVQFIPAYALSFYFNSLFTVLGRGLDLKGKTKLSFVPSLVGVLTSLAIYIPFGEKYGVTAILWGVFWGGLTRSLTGIFIAAKFFPRKFYWKRLFGTFFIGGLFYLALNQIKIEDVWLSLFTKISVILVLAALLFGLLLKNNLKSLIPKEPSPSNRP